MSERTYLDISLLVSDPRNARKHDRKNLNAIKGSLKQFGQQKPIVVTDDYLVLAGNGTVAAAKELKWDKIWVNITQLRGTKAQAYALADNQSGALAEWDDKQLNDLLIELKQQDFDVTEIGFDEPEISDEARDAAEDEVPEVPQNIHNVQRGQIWELGSHRLMCGDSTSKDDVERLMNGEKADMVFTDPPYGMFLDTDFSSAKGSLGRSSNTRGNKYSPVIGDNEDFKPALIETIFNNFNYCKEIFLFGADYFAELLPDKNEGSWLVWDKRKESQSEAIGAEFELIWSKSKHKRRMLRHDWFGFLSSENANEARNRVHPTQKPTSLLSDILGQWSDDNNLIADPYLGSGSTLIACEKTNRKCYGMEIDPHYCSVIIERWQNYTGKTASLETGKEPGVA